MKRFVKVALLLAAFSVLACGAAFAAYPLDLPGDLVSPTDVRLISQDWAGDNEGDSLMAPADKAKSGLSNPAYQEYDVFADSTDLIFSNDYGYFVTDEAPTVPAAGVSFDKTLVRSLFETAVPMKFVVSTDQNDTFDFALRGGAERTVAAKDRLPVQNTVAATDCNIACNNFYFNMPEGPVSRDFDAVRRTFPATINWTGAGDTEFYVECCDYFGLVVSAGAGGTTDAATLSRDFVVAHLSEKPFLRARTADGFNVGPVSKDFRDKDEWTTEYFNTKGAVDIPEGKTYHMGVVYAVSGDCSPCDGWICDDANLPYVAVTNLGTAAVNVQANIADSEGLVIDSNNMITSNTSWVCNLWCGLCEYDDFMSSEKGSIGGPYPASAKGRSSLYDCGCYLFPAFTETWKGAGNKDWNYRAHKAEGSDVVTRIDGRFNTAWTGGSLTTSGICDSCTSKAVYVYWPCECLKEFYKGKTLGYTDLSFAEKADLTLELFKEDKAEGAYVSRKAVMALAPAKVVASADVENKKNANIVLTRLDWTVKADDLNDAGLVGLKGLDGDWWREQFWNKLNVTINGHVLNEANVENVSAKDFTVDELSFLTVLDGPQRDLSTTTNVDVRLFVFVMDSDTDAVKYYKTSTGNRFLVVYDGKLDGKFSYEASISKAAAPDPAKLTVNPPELKLYLDSKTTETLKAEHATGTVKWTVDQAEEFVSISPDQGAEVTVTALKVTPGNVKVIATDDKTSADCVVTVDAKKPVSPDQPGSGGGCSMGFAPAALLLLAPLGFLRRK